MFEKFIGTVATALGLAFVMPASAEDAAPDLTHFPYEVIEVTGAQALAEWRKLRTAGRGTPIIVGSARDAEMLAEAFHPDYGFGDTPQEALEKAAALTHPASMESLRKAETAAFEKWARDNGKEDLIAPPGEDDAIDPDLEGDWPEHPEINPGLLALTDYSTGRFYETVYIALLPTDDPTEAPAWLRLGGWNAHPPAEYHAAAFRSWRDRYGAIPVVITHEVIELQVARRPQSRKYASALAREQFDYCADIVTQGVGSLTALGASLQASDWWYFWWD